MPPIGDPGPPKWSPISSSDSSCTDAAVPGAAPVSCCSVIELTSGTGTSPIGASSNKPPSKSPPAKEKYYNY